MQIRQENLSLHLNTGKTKPQMNENSNLWWKAIAMEITLIN